VGSTFSFILTHDLVAGSTPPALAGFARRQILLIDDHRTSRATLSAMLAQWDLLVWEADGAEAALAQLAAHPETELAIMNLRAAGEIQSALAARLHALPGRNLLPLVQVLSYAQRNHIDKSAFAISLFRPLKTGSLHTTVSNIINLRPESAPRLANTSQASAELRNANTGVSILLVEDNAVNQKVALNMLKRLGFSPDLAANGLEAVKAVAEKDYTVILMDMQMPEMNGMEASLHIRQTQKEDRPRPWIIALTANALKEFRKDCLDTGMDDYLSKPVKIEDLRGAIQRRPSEPA
jgi:CheY-like chemotaxis protein